MARPTTASDADPRVADYRYDRAKRKNNPPAGLAAHGRIAEQPKEHYAYDPHLPPVLRFDPTGKADDLPELLQVAKTRKLNDEEIDLLAAALRRHEPWLEWTGKRERKSFEVDPVALHIHERVAAKAILAVAARQDVQRSLFADPQQEYRQAVQFYQHEVDWANRLILGDSLQVMSSLAKREGLAGKVQMIYIDPPYGIRYASNFQPQIGQRDVKDREGDLTREPEMVRAYRDTWNLGIHSYLSYLRDRFIAARELLTDSGSVFLQIGEENLTLVREVMDEVFGRKNFCRVIAFVTTSFQADSVLANSLNYLLWYARDKGSLRANRLYRRKTLGVDEAEEYRWLLLQDGSSRPLTEQEASGSAIIPSGSRPWRHGPLTSQGFSEIGSLPYRIGQRSYSPGPNQHWKTSHLGLDRVHRAGLLIERSNSLSHYMFLDSYPVLPFTNLWIDTKWGFDASEKSYVVQTNVKVIERCLLMTTDPGDLVLDPTCGSGTTAYVAEQWGRRWIAIDTSRVAVAIARQRLLTATFDQYRLREGGSDPATGFVYKTVPHITLKSIAQNVALDPVFARHEPILSDRLAALNTALASVTPDLRTRLQTKLVQKERAEGKRTVTDADRRRWLLPKEGWQEWEVPFDADSDWPAPLAAALAAFRASWRAKMDEVNAVIAASAEQEELVDQPEVVKGVVRVSGPFTVESVLPAEENLDLEPNDSLVSEWEEELDTFNNEVERAVDLSESKNAEAYLDRMTRYLRTDGARFLDNKQVRFIRLDPLADDVLHAEGEWVSDGGDPRAVAVTFGPQYGDVTAALVEKTLHRAARRGYDDLLFAGFSFDAAAQQTIQEDPNPRVRSHLVQIRPDVNPGMDGLLKQTPNSQLFTVMGLPRTRVDATSDGHWIATMEGVDIYDPVENVVRPTGADKVAAWFVDSDFDGRTFCICQAFFPDKSAWDKLARDLKGVVDPDAFAVFAGTVSLPFPAGRHGKVAVKVIDPRGSEVMRVHPLTDEAVYGAR